MPQSEDKLALDALNKEIETVIDKVINLEIILAESKAKLSNLQYQKKSMENILSMQQTIVNSIQKQQDELIKKRLNRILGAVLLLLIIVALMTCNNEPKPLNVVEDTNPLNEIVKDKDAINAVLIENNKALKIKNDSLLAVKPKTIYRKIYVYDSLLIADTACINSLVTLYNQCAKVDSVNEFIISNQSSQIANLVTVTNNQQDIIDIRNYQHNVDSINEVAYKEQVKLEIKNSKRKYRKGLLQGGAVGLGVGFIGGLIVK